MSNYTYSIGRIKDVKGIIDGFFIVLMIILFGYYSPWSSLESLQPDYAKLLWGLPFVAVALIVRALIVMPLFYVWAFQKPIDARVVLYELKGSLPFYPKRKWYLPFIPFQSRYKNEMEALVFKLDANTPIAEVDMDYTETSVSTKKMWLVLGPYLIIATLLFFLFLTHISIVMEGKGMPVFGIFVLIVFVMHLVRIIKFVMLPNKLTIDVDGIGVGNRFVSWADVDNVMFDWGNTVNERLIVVLKNGDRLKLAVSVYNLDWRQLYNYALHFHHQHIQKPAVN